MSRFARLTFIAGVLSALLLGLAACGGADDSGTTSKASSAAPSSATTVGKKTIGVVPSTLTSEYLAGQVQRLKATAQAIGWDVKVIDGAGDPQKMDQAIQTFVSQKVDAVFTMALGGEEISGGLAQAKSAGVPVIAVGQSVSPGQEKNFAAVFGDDTLGMGKIAADYLVKSHTTNPIVGIRLTQNFAGDGFIQGMFPSLKAGGLKFQDLRDTKLSDLINSITQNTEAIIQKNKGPLTMVDFGDFGSPVMTGVLDRAGRDDVTIITRYDNPSTVKMMKAGKKIAVVTTKGYTHTFDAITALLNLWTKQTPLPSEPQTSEPGGGVFTVADLPKGGNTIFAFKPDLDAQVAKWRTSFGPK
jgi:ABC-type sugar transport system substrate-binding protein